MPKCIVCGDKATRRVKGTQNYYCDSCGKELFADINYLQKVEAEAKALKDEVDSKLSL